jgi:multicomponent Na+:H+ antiporter subunit B
MVIVGMLASPLFFSNDAWPTVARNHLERYGESESGARNLVSAIYLGYRAFDTLGETIVLLAAVLGTITYMQAGSMPSHGAGLRQTIAHRETGGVALIREQRPSHALRTHLLQVVAGKLAPVVLLFGFYVMLFGHLSPGGGFQGGAIVASGILFLALGSDTGSATPLASYKVLSRLEAAMFLILVLVCIAGLASGAGILISPIGDIAGEKAGFIMFLNIVIGMKVGASLGLMCMLMMGRNH